MAKQKKKRKKRSKQIADTPTRLTVPLEEIDPSENYKGTEFEGLDAFQRQLKRFNIKITGNNEPESNFFKS